jgi:hypothetical protein
MEDVKPISRKSLHELAKISILLDTYDDMFSDFDPSEYAERTLSDDFIVQAQKISKNKDGAKMSLELLLPASARNEKDEKVIIKRLYSHFNDSYQQVKSDIKKTNRKGILLTAIGTVLMVAASYLSYMKPEKYHLHFLIVLFEPAGWFLLWAGLDHLVYRSKITKNDVDFYAKMVKSEIKFLTN